MAETTESIGLRTYAGLDESEYFDLRGQSEQFSNNSGVGESVKLYITTRSLRCNRRRQALP